MTTSVKGGSHGNEEHRTSLSVAAYVIWQSGANSVKICRGTGHLTVSGYEAHPAQVAGTLLVAHRLHSFAADTAHEQL